MRSRIDLILAVAVLVVAVVGVGAYVQSSQADRDATDRVRNVATAAAVKLLRDQAFTQIETLREGCVRSLTDRAEGIQRDQDLSDFLTAAALARRAEGNVKTAVIYERIAARALTRKASAAGRMLGADPNPDRITASAKVVCAKNYPTAPTAIKPVLLPIAHPASAFAVLPYG